MRSISKRVWSKTWPKLLVMIAGIILYLIGIRLNENLKGLLINISSSLISIPTIFIFYDIWQEKSHRKLNERVYKYAENEMSLVMLETRDQMEMLLSGFSIYFEFGDYMVDDSDIKKLRIKLNDEAKIICDEDGDPYQKNIKWKSMKIAFRKIFIVMKKIQ